MFTVVEGAIAHRLEDMLRTGLLDEVRRLWLRGDLHPELPAIRAVGYRQFWAHLEGETTQEEAEQAVLFATRQLAKRQLTWLRRWPADAWLKTGQSGELLAVEGSSAPIWRQFAAAQTRWGNKVGPLHDSENCVAAPQGVVEAAMSTTF